MKKKLLMMLAGIALFAACKNHGPYEVAHGSSEADTVKIDSSSTAVNGNKLVKTAIINFKVKDVQHCSEQVGALTNTYHGMVLHHNITSTAGNSKDIKLNEDSIMRVSSFETRGEITVKIPQEHLEAFTDSVSRLGIYVNSSQLDIEDKSLEYLSAKMKTNNRAELVKQQKTGKVLIKSPTAVINLKDDLVDGQIESLQIDRDVKYSVVSLSFYQSNTILKETLANDNPSVYDLPFFKRLALAFANGWYLFKELILLLADLWTALIIGGIIWIVVKVTKNKRSNAAQSA